MNILFTALTVLSNITGFASSQNYDTSAEHLLDCMFEHFGEYSPLAVEESILNSKDIYDMDIPIQQIGDQKICVYFK